MYTFDSKSITQLLFPPD